MPVPRTEPPPVRPRRERELASLYATARSLTALGELDDVLQSIVRHAHELIGTDFTYLSLLGPEDELSIRASEGTISAAFRAARIPRGTGLGGKVIETRTPVWVSNYLAAADVKHDRNFDGLVDPEGMVALLGVPLLVRGEAIGALFAADRSERTFETDEIALLCAFADHAAVALDNARLWDESRAALQRLQAAYRTIEEQVATMERAQSVHEALTEVILTGGGPGEVAQRLVEHLGGAVTVLDRDGAVLAARAVAGEPELDAAATPEVAEALERARRTGRCATTSGGSGRWHSVATIQAGDTYLGALALSAEHEPSAIDVRTFERATHIMGLLILKENAVADAAERLSGELLTELLLGGPAVSPTQRSRTRARGIDVDGLTLVVVADSPTLSTAELSRRLHAVARERRGLAGEHLGRATLLIPSSDDDETARAVHRQLRRAAGRAVTVIAERVSGQEWSRAFGLASRCCALVQALGTVDVGATTSRYALYALLFDADRGADLDRFVTDAIGPLLDYDRQRATALVPTLTAYYAHGANLARTARALHIHLNTLLKRLDRATAVLGCDWRNDGDLQRPLALRLHELRGRLG